MTNKIRENNEGTNNEPDKKSVVISSASTALTGALREQQIQALRDAFDVMFGKLDMTDEYKKTLERYWLLWLMLTDAEKAIDSEAKMHWISQYRQDLAHVSLGMYTTLQPADIEIDIPQTSGSYKFIFTIPGRMLCDNFTLFSWTEDMHRKLFERYLKEHTDTKEWEWKEYFKGSDEVTIPGGWRIDVDAEAKYITFYGSSGSYGYIADKVIEWATKKLRDQGWTTDISMAHAGKNN